MATLIISSAVKECEGKSSIEYPRFHVEDNQLYAIKDTIDLEGQIIELPPGVTLCPKGGIIVNGTLVGKDTKIKGQKQLFDHVTIKGTWKVPQITTELFADLNYENSLQDVLGLTSNDCDNTVCIKKGKYSVSTKSGGGALVLKSNTVLVIDGEVELIPNRHDICYIMLVKDANNVVIKGKGVLLGDKDKHIGSTGEWGMGIHIINSENVEVSGLTIKNCWGDCIYVGQKSKDVSIYNCMLENGRRQGISITSAKNVQIHNCDIKNIHGTLPECAIDIEPNKFQAVEDVLISKVHIVDCGGGILAYGGAKFSEIKGITIADCDISGKMTHIPYSFYYANDVTVSKSKSYAKVRTSILASDIKYLELKDNDLLATTREIIKVENCSEIVKRANIERVIE